MDTPKKASDGASPPLPGLRLQDRLAAVAKEKPDGGRARTIVYVVVGGAALVAVILQLLGITKSPVAEHMEQHLRDQGRIPKAAPADAPGETPPESPMEPGPADGMPR